MPNNHEGKSLSLHVAILKAKNYDERNFVSCKIQDNYGIAKSVIDLTKDSIDFDMEERRLSLKDQQERQLRERLELEKLKREFNITQ
ncbi:hypothetical protein C1646_762219 [Rhizophagus diaphanus]|nr:hypothetical protein C1646_762219 [Rhizophagus diaphanus] [Rhizophagus sp. MUCL 43196]